VEPLFSAIIYGSLFLGLYFQIFLLLSFFERESVCDTQTSGDRLPTITITVPCFNEAKTLEKTVRSILSLNYPKEKISILIIDDGSKDETLSVAKKLEMGDSRIQAIHKENGGKYTALNLAISISKTELFACLDADSEVDRDALLKMVPYFSNPKVAAVTPAIRSSKPKNLLQYAQRIEYIIGVFTKHVLGKLNAMYVTPGPFSVFRKEIFDVVGNFRKAHNTEDMEMALRIKSRGFLIKNSSESHVFTITPSTINGLYKQRVRWTYGFIRNIFEYRHLLMKRNYGAMGILILPFSTISIGFIIALAGIFVYNTGIEITEAAERISILGITWDWPSFDWFFLWSDASSAILPFIVVTSFIIILAGKKISGEKVRPSWDMLIFFPVYAFIVPFWMIKAVWNTALAKDTPWR
jgi:peptidoglycan-N-acetylglucosamine deacetylase